MKFKTLIPFLITFLVIFLFYIKRIVILKFYPPICNFLIFFAFFSSIFSSETLVEKFARVLDGKLSEKTIKYTKKVNLIWVVFTFLNFIASIVTIFCSDKIWMIYNGMVSYLLIGLIFIVEYIIRIILKRKKLL